VRCQARKCQARCQTGKPTVKHLSNLDREVSEEGSMHARCLLRGARRCLAEVCSSVTR
jgi:hypothetical protein